MEARGRVRQIDRKTIRFDNGRWRGASPLLHAVARKVADDVRLDCLRRRDVGVAAGRVALLEPGKSAPLERTRQLRLDPQRRTIIVDG
jgi:hypothetical protein